MSFSFTSTPAKQKRRVYLCIRLILRIGAVMCVGMWVISFSVRHYLQWNAQRQSIQTTWARYTNQRPSWLHSSSVLGSMVKGAELTRRCSKQWSLFHYFGTGLHVWCQSLPMDKLKRFTGSKHQRGYSVRGK